MAFIAALLPNEGDRRALVAAAGEHRLLWADSWRGLNTLVRDRPVAAVVTDLHAEPRKDGALRVYRFAQRYPLTPLVGWGSPDGRELFRIGKAGARDVVLAHDATDAVLIGEVLAASLRAALPRLIRGRLAGRIDDQALMVIGTAADRIPDGIQVPDLAAVFGYSISTLERRCEALHLPTPGRMLLWLRVLFGLRWLLEDGRSVESVAAQLGYSSGAAFRRAIKATVGGRPTPLRNAAAFDQALENFAVECGASSDGGN
jgi:AraC-like DNA-binding protein